MIDKRANGGPKVRFAEEHHALQTLGLGGLDKAFGERVQIRTPGREDQWLHPTVTQQAPECRGVERVLSENPIDVPEGPIEQAGYGVSSGSPPR
jgi:hypothetical protein